MPLIDLVRGGISQTARGHLARLEREGVSWWTPRALERVTDRIMADIQRIPREERELVRQLVREEQRAREAGQRLELTTRGGEGSLTRNQIPVTSACTPTGGGDIQYTAIVTLYDPATGQTSRTPYDISSGDTLSRNAVEAAIRRDVESGRPPGPPPPGYVQGGPLEVREVQIVHVCRIPRGER